MEHVSTITFQNGRQHIESFLSGRNIIMYVSSVRVLCERWRFTGILCKLLIGKLQQVAWAQWAARNMTGGTLKCEGRIFIHHAGLQFMQTYFITLSFLFQFCIPVIINLSLMDNLSKVTSHLSQYVLYLYPNATPSFFSPFSSSFHTHSLPPTHKHRRIQLPLITRSTFQSYCFVFFSC